MKLAIESENETGMEYVSKNREKVEYSTKFRPKHRHTSLRGLIHRGRHILIERRIDALVELLSHRLSQGLSYRLSHHSAHLRTDRLIQLRAHLRPDDSAHRLPHHSADRGAHRSAHLHRHGRIARRVARRIAWLIARLIARLEPRRVHHRTRLLRLRDRHTRRLRRFLRIPAVLLASLPRKALRLSALSVPSGLLLRVSRLSRLRSQPSLLLRLAELKQFPRRLGAAQLGVIARHHLLRHRREIGRVREPAREASTRRLAAARRLVLCCRLRGRGRLTGGLRGRLRGGLLALRARGLRLIPCLPSLRGLRSLPRLTRGLLSLIGGLLRLTRGLLSLIRGLLSLIGGLLLASDGVRLASGWLEGREIGVLAFLAVQVVRPLRSWRCRFGLPSDQGSRAGLRCGLGGLRLFFGFFRFFFRLFGGWLGLSFFWFRRVRFCVRFCVRLCIRLCVRFCIRFCIRLCIRLCICLCVRFCVCIGIGFCVSTLCFRFPTTFLVVLTSAPVSVLPRLLCGDLLLLRTRLSFRVLCLCLLGILISTLFCFFIILSIVYRLRILMLLSLDHFFRSGLI